MSVSISGGEKLKAVFKQFSELESKSLHVGFLQPEIATIAVTNEFGATYPVTPKVRAFFEFHGFHLKETTTTITIPARPFMQKTVDEHSDEWATILPKLLKKYDYNVDNCLAALGKVISGNITNTIESGDFVPNHPLTIKLKQGKTTPLVNTGEMAKSVAYEVV